MVRVKILVNENIKFVYNPTQNLICDMIKDIKQFIMEVFNVEIHKFYLTTFDGFLIHNTMPISILKEDEVLCVNSKEISHKKELQEKNKFKMSRKQEMKDVILQNILSNASKIKDSTEFKQDVLDNKEKEISTKLVPNKNFKHKENAISKEELSIKRNIPEDLSTKEHLKKVSSIKEDLKEDKEVKKQKIFINNKKEKNIENANNFIKQDKEHINNKSRENELNDLLNILNQEVAPKQNNFQEISNVNVNSNTVDGNKNNRNTPIDNKVNNINVDFNNKELNNKELNIIEKPANKKTIVHENVKEKNKTIEKEVLTKKQAKGNKKALKPFKYEDYKHLIENDTVEKGIDVTQAKLTKEIMEEMSHLKDLKKKEHKEKQIESIDIKKLKEKQKQ